MGIHGDDAQSYKTSANYKVIVMQWNSVLSEQQSFLSRFLLSMFAYNRIFFTWMKWCLLVLWDGRWPIRDHAGRPYAEADGYRFKNRNLPFAGGWRMLWCQLRGDMKLFLEAFRWNSYSHDLCCHKCLASKTNAAVLYSDVRPDAGWRDTLISTEDYVQNVHGLFKSAVCDWLGFDISRILQDPMHGLNLGCAEYLAGLLASMDSKQLKVSSLYGEMPSAASAHSCISEVSHLGVRAGPPHDVCLHDR